MHLDSAIQRRSKLSPIYTFLKNAASRTIICGSESTLYGILLVRRSDLRGKLYHGSGGCARLIIILPKITLNAIT